MPMKYGRTLICVALSLVLLGSISMFAFGIENSSYPPKNGFVPDEATAIRIAEAILIPIYGEEEIKNERPFHAVLKNQVWIVEGSLPEGMLGGVAVVELSKKDGQIMKVNHGK